MARCSPMLATLPLHRPQSDRDYYGLIVANPRTSDTRRRWAKWQLAGVVAEIEKREKVSLPPSSEAHTA